MHRTSTPRDGRLILAVLCAAQFLVVVDITVVNVALPAIRDDLGIGPAQLHWAVSAYAVTFGGLLLVAGRLADVVGRRRVFLAGVALFGGCSIACGLAPDGAALAASRALQGAGAALVSPAALAIVAQAFPEGGGRARALSVWATVGAIAAASGVLLGGVLVEILGWRWIFFLNAPVAAGALALGPAVLPRGRRDLSRRVDPLAAALVSAVPALLVAGLAQASASAPGAPPVLGLVGGAMAAGILAWRRDRGSADPLLPARLLRAPAAAAAYAAGSLHGAIMLGTFLLLSIQMQAVLGLSALETGAGLLAARATAAAVAPVGARLVSAVGARAVLAGAMATMTAGLALLAGRGGGDYAADLLPGLLLMGVAIAPLFLTVNLLALEGAPAADAGLVSGLLNTAQWVGGALGVTAVSVVAGGSGHDQAALAAGVGAGLWACTALGVAGTALALALARPPRRFAAAPARSAG